MMATLLTQCCVPKCPMRVRGGKYRVYPLPTPSENKELIEKWVYTVGGGPKDVNDVFASKKLFVCETHFQDLYLDSPGTQEKNSELQNNSSGDTSTQQGNNSELEKNLSDNLTPSVVVRSAPQKEQQKNNSSCETSTPQGNNSELQKNLSDNIHPSFVVRSAPQKEQQKNNSSYDTSTPQGNNLEPQKNLSHDMIRPFVVRSAPQKENTMQQKSNLSGAEAPNVISEFKTIDLKQVKSVDIRKCGVEKPKAILPSSDPVFVLQKKKTDGKEKPTLFVLQPINKGDKENENHTQTTTGTKELNNQTANKNSATNSKESNLNLSKTNSHTTPKTHKPIILRGSTPLQTYKTVKLIPPLQTDQPVKPKIPLQTDQPVKPKIPLQTETPVKPKAEISKLPILKINKLKTIVKPNELKQLPQPVKFMSLKSFSKLFMSSNAESIRVDTETLKPIIQKVGKGLVINMESDKSGPKCELNTIVTKATQDQQPQSKSNIIEKHQVKENALCATDDTEFNIIELDPSKVDHHKGNFPKAMYHRENVSKVVDSSKELNKDEFDVAEIEINDGEFDIPEVDLAKIEHHKGNLSKVVNHTDNVANVKVSRKNLNVDEFDVAEIEINDADFDVPLYEPVPRMPQFKYQPRDATVKDSLKKMDHELANVAEHEKASTADKNHQASQEQSRVLKTYLKNQYAVPKASPPSPVNFLKDDPKPPVLSKTAITGERPLTILAPKIATTLTNRPTDRVYVTIDFKLIESKKNNPAVHRYINEAIEKMKARKLSHEEAENLKRLIYSYQKQYQELNKELQMYKKRIISLRNRMADYKVNSKSKAFDKITKDMTDDGKMLVKMLIAHKLKPRGRRFNLQEKLFSLALFKLSRPAYRYMSSILALPRKVTLNRFLNELYDKLHSQKSATDIISQEVKNYRDKEVNGAVTINNLEENGTVTINNSEENGAVTNNNSEENGSVTNNNSEENGAITNNNPLENEPVTNNNSEENDETIAAVAAITGETASRNSDRCAENNNNAVNGEIEYLLHQMTYPNVEAHKGKASTQADDTNGNGISMINEIVFTHYVDLTKEQTPRTTQIPSKYGTIKIGYSEYTHRLDQMPSSEDLTNSQETIANLLKLHQNTINSMMSKKPKRYISGMTEEKIQKINFVLLKLMTPDQLRSLRPGPSKKKKKKKSGVGAKQTISKPKVLRKVAPKRVLTNNISAGNIMKRKRNFKTNTPALQNHAAFANHSYTPQVVANLEPFITNTYNNELCVEGIPPNYELTIPQNIQNYAQYAQTNVDAVDHVTDRFSRPVKVIPNEYIGNLNAEDTLTKPRKNLKIYSPKRLKNNLHSDASSSAKTKIGHSKDSFSRQVIANENIKDSNAMDTVTKLKRNLEKYSSQASQTNTSYMDRQVIANEDINDSNAVDTVTKLRRNLEKYSPQATQSNVDGLDVDVPSNAHQIRILSNLDYKKLQQHKRKNVNDLEERPFKVKKTRKLVIDESKFPQHSSGKYSPELFILGTRDVRTTNEVMHNINNSQPQNSPQYETEESVRGKGFDMPDLSEGFDSSFDKKHRKKIGFKRLPTNPFH